MQDKSDKSIELGEILDQQSYELDQEDQLYLEDLKKFEKRKAKLWTKPEFQSHLHAYAKLKYNKDLNINSVAAFRVYKRLYHDTIKNGNNYGLYEKILYHPDLTLIDYEFITDQKSKVLRNAGITELIGVTGFGIAYLKTNLKSKPLFYPMALIGPAVLLYSAYGFYTLKFHMTLKKLELDKKYNVT